MYLLYLDESGNESNPSDRYFVLGGIALFERQTYFLSKAFDDIQERHFPNLQPLPFHASEMRSGRDFWRRVTPEVRQAVVQDLCAAIADCPAKGRHLFAAAVEKTKDLYGEQAVEKATEEVCRRFDILLTRRYHEQSDAQRGLLIFSEGRFDARAKIWVRGFHQRGTSWGAINNLADIPYFAAMSESRLLQAADIVAHGVWLLYERRDASIARALLPCLAQSDGVLHGLVHVRGTASAVCDCPACFSRRQQWQYGPWVQPPAAQPGPAPDEAAPASRGVAGEGHRSTDQ